MSRNIFIQTHLLIAALFTPMILLVVVSGGLYLLGVKGQIEQTPVTTPPSAVLNISSDELETEVRNLLAELDPSYSFEYLKVKENVIYTRPTSRKHYEIVAGGDKLSINKNDPSLQKSLVELHKGHGPRAFKTAQKFMAGGLLLMLLTGVWLGLSSRILRTRTVVVMGIGTIATIALATLL